MDEGRAAGRTIIAAVSGPDLAPGEIRALAELAPAGVILFSRNLKSPAQTRDLIAGLREVCPGPILLSVDLEGGRVNRLAGLHPALGRLPEARLQARWGEARIEECWRLVGEALASLGIDVDFAPVVDIDGGDGGNAIGPRSFGTDPRQVTAFAGAVLRGLAAAGVAGCLKHFPGLGETDRDTHRELASCVAPAERLWERHVLPFRELASCAPLVMTAHAHYEAIDGPEPLPATFSRKLIGEWLRRRCGFEGLIVTDDLEMGAVLGCGTPGARALRALAAGADLLLFCGGLDAPRHARDAVARAIARGDLDGGAIEASAGRLEAFRRRRGGEPAARPLERFAEAVSRLEERIA